MDYRQEIADYNNLDGALSLAVCGAKFATVYDMAQKLYVLPKKRVLIWYF
jgi:hypothetical protein